MCVRVCVCACVRVYVCVHVDAYQCICICLMQVHTTPRWILWRRKWKGTVTTCARLPLLICTPRFLVSVCLCVCVSVCLCVCACVRACVHACYATHVHACKHTRARAYMCGCAHIRVRSRLNKSHSGGSGPWHFRRPLVRRLTRRLVRRLVRRSIPQTPGHQRTPQRL